MNGFLIAEIFSRYFPEKMSYSDFESKKYYPISMHSFINSTSENIKKNNWVLLESFFKKN